MMRFLLMALLMTILFSICLMLVSRTTYLWSLDRTRRRGLLPTGRKPTLDDVRNLLLRGERVTAVDTYRRIYKLTQRQAELEVDLLERNLQKNKKDGA